MRPLLLIIFLFSVSVKLKAQLPTVENFLVFKAPYTHQKDSAGNFAFTGNDSVIIKFFIRFDRSVYDVTQITVKIGDTLNSGTFINENVSISNNTGRFDYTVFGDTKPLNPGKNLTFLTKKLPNQSFRWATVSFTTTTGLQSNKKYFKLY